MCIRDSISHNLNRISGEVQDKISALNGLIKEIKDQSSLGTKGITENCSKLQAAHQSLNKESSNVGKLLEEQAKNIDVAVSRTKMQAEDINAIFNQQKDSLADIANSLATQTRLGEASLAQQYKYLSDAATDVSQKMSEINQAFKDNTAEVFETSTKIAYEFDVLGDRLIKAGEDIAKASKNSLKNVEQVNMALSQCGEELDSTIHHSVCLLYTSPSPRD